MINNSSNNVFYNNIFWSKNAKWNNNIFDHNAYYGGLTAPSNDMHKITENPGLASPGSGQKGFGTLDGYKLIDGSPCFLKGKIVSDIKFKDFWNIQIADSASPNIGVYNGAGKSFKQ